VWVSFMILILITVSKIFYGHKGGGKEILKQTLKDEW